MLSLLSHPGILSDCISLETSAAAAVVCRCARSHTLYFIDKLGYLVFKDKDPMKIGGALNGYQLSAPFDSFEKMKKQTGIIFYTQAGYTSATDPLMGFRKNIYIGNSAPRKKIVDAICKFKAIGWSDKHRSYFFTYDPIDFAEKKSKKYIFSKEWTVYAKAPRIRREKDENGHWKYEPVDINKKIKELLKCWEFKDVEGNILEQVQAMESNGLLRGEKDFDGKERSFYHSFIYLFNLILQLRNSYSEQWAVKEEGGKTIARRVGEDIDFIASPVEPFFSTKAVNKAGKELSPKNPAGFENKIINEKKEKILNEYNGDANGAYNIARKGIILLNKIKENPEKPGLFISNKEWDEFMKDNCPH